MRKDYVIRDMCFSGRGTPIYNTHTAPSIKVHQDPIPWSGVVLSLPQASPPITSDMTKTRTRVWHKGYEDDMKESSASAFVLSRVLGIFQEISTTCYQTMT